MASLWKISRMFFPPILDQDQMTPANGLLKVISPIWDLFKSNIVENTEHALGKMQLTIDMKSQIG